MTDDLPDPTPEQEAEVTRLLAEAGGPVAVPDEVLARLDATLAELVAGARAGSSDQATSAAAPVAPLAARRSSRRWPRLVLAAASVVVAGYAIGTVVNDSSSGDAESAVAGDAAEESHSGGGSVDEHSPGAADDPGPGEQAAPSATTQRDSDGSLLGGLVARLRSDRLEADVGEVLATRTALGFGDRSDRRVLSATRSPSCPPPALARGQRWLPARYDGQRAVLVTAREDDGTVPAAVYDCDGDLLASVVVDAD